MVSENNHYDIIIVGGGMVGASLACSLDNQNVSIAVIEAVPIKAGNQPSYDDRGLALSLSSKRILRKLDLWEEVAVNACAIEHVHVSDRGHFGFVRLHASDLNVDALGHVVIARELGRALMSKIGRAKNINYLCPAEVHEIKIDYDNVAVDLSVDSESKRLTGKLLVVADGTNSRLRQQLGIATLVKDYNQTAIVTNVTTERPHNNTAYERFTESGPIALLPLHGQKCVLVYTVPADEAETYLQLEMNEFLDRLCKRFGRRLGRFSRIGALKLYPLKYIESEEQVLSRVVLLGSSAHTIHPNGAQGFNLCLRDVAALSEHLESALVNQLDIGDKKILDGYFNSREQDQKRVMQFSDRLATLFYNRNLPKIIFRDTGMLITDIIPSVKREFLRRAMGLSGRQPAMVSAIQV